MGDFNLPDVNWGYHNTATIKSVKFLKHVENNFLSLSKPTKKCALPDLLLNNREGLVREVTVGGCHGHRDLEIVEFKIFGVRNKKVSRVATLDFKRANFKLLRKLHVVSSVPWELGL